MKRRHAWPKGHWSWPVDITHKHGMRSGSMIWIGGQLDMTEAGEVCHAGDVFAQIPPVVRHVERVLEDLEAGLTDLVKLLGFYVNDGSLDESTVLAAIAAALPPEARPAITLIPVPYLAYPGIALELEGYAMRGEDGAALPRSFAPSPGLSPLSDRFAQAVRCGKRVTLGPALHDIRNP